MLLATSVSSVLNLIYDVFAGRFYGYVLLGMLILALICQIKVKTTFSKYNKITPANRMKASEAARLILDMNGLYDVDVVHIPRNLNDHYDHSRKAVCLSDSTFDINSIGAIGVAAHECGHAIQYARGYGPIKLRNNIAPAIQFVSGAWFWVLAVGFLFEWMVAIEIGIVFYSAVVLFQLITLPVEFDASKRAINTLFANQILTGTELDGARKVLNAAAMTYVASFITSVVQLLRLILIARGKRR